MHLLTFFMVVIRMEQMELVSIDILLDCTFFIVLYCWIHVLHSHILRLE